MGKPNAFNNRGVRVYVVSICIRRLPLVDILFFCPFHASLFYGAKVVTKIRATSHLF